MRSSAQNNIRFQSEHHGLVHTKGFRTLEEKMLFLMHLKAYESVKMLVQEKTVLDIGCNNGYGTKVINSFCRKAIGVDVSPTAIQEAKRQYGQDGIDFVLVDGIHLPFKDDKFDILMSFQVIEHINCHEVYLNEIKRVLIPAGKVIFSTPNALIRIDPGMKPWNRFHIREFSASQLKELLQEYFPKVRIRGLFAREPLYSVELNRNKKYLENARRCSAHKHTFRAIIKSILPDSAINMISNIIHLMNPIKINKSISELTHNITLQQYSTDDLYYKDNKLDQSLDLLGICDTSD